MSNNREKYTLQLQYIYSLMQNKLDRNIENIRQTAPESSKEMQLSTIEGSVLALIIKLIAPKLVLEIGTLVGYSAAWMASQMPSGSKLVSFERNESHYQIAKDNFSKVKFDCEIELVLNNNLDEIEKYCSKYGQCFDVMFFDGAKAEYIEYFEIAKKFIRSGGVAIFDNVTTFYGSGRKLEQKIDEFNKIAFSDNRISFSTIIPTTEGLLICFVK